MENNEIDQEMNEIDLEDILSLDSLACPEASNVARDITVAWIQNNKYEDNLTEEEVSIFYKTMYQAARFPTLWDEDEDEGDDDLDDEGATEAEDEA